MKNKNLKNKNFISEILLFCALNLVMVVTGYFLFWQVFKRTQISSWYYLSISITFAAILTFMVLVLRYLFIHINLEIQEKIDLQNSYLEQLNKTYEGTLKALTYALDFRDHETWGHSARVVGYAIAIGERMGLNQEDLQQLAWGGFLHDIGKIGVPDAILLKKARLEADEWETIKRHPQMGHGIVNQISANLNFSQITSDIVLYHHEHYDGKGYPYGLKGEEIPLSARIFAVADALDAMTSDRPYRPGCSMEEAIMEIRSLAGRQFCPWSVKALLEIGLKELKRIQGQVLEMGDVTNIRERLIPVNFHRY